ncbi:P-loop NTPase fold protein, partial [Roseibium sp.]
MSLSVLKKEIHRFISTPMPEVLCLKGGWGVGKTYLWNKCLDEAKESGRIGLNAYSYVSLFGLKNLSDLRMSVFEGRHALKAAASSEESWSLKKIVDKINEKANFRSRAGLLKALPFVGNLSEEEVIGLVSLAQSPQQIVCIDDIERRGDGLTVKDILGFASYLKEERSCKVIIILNEEQL